MERHGNVIAQEGGFPLVLVMLLLGLALATCTSKSRKMNDRGSVKGILHDSTGKPIGDAVVMIAGGPHDFTDLACVSNEQGEFSVSNIVIPGTYTLQIRAGNESKTKVVDIKTKDTILHIAF